MKDLIIKLNGGEAKLLQAIRTADPFQRPGYIQLNEVSAMLEEVEWRLLLVQSRTFRSA